ncbi:heterokaryon incompatibility protein-domain-containing protein [Apiospora kogelbergensis]|uniref:heterokaryon incompatibility protein-domain-containing protein n=1 Tax=Apiospora kogelbergensis TaxID=1337665 RepID=UPI003131FF48
MVSCSGDGSDWDRESSSMDSIYQDAYLIIAASSSPNVNVSFLDRQFPTRSVDLRLKRPDGRDLTIRARKRPACGVHSSHDAADPWRRRAWTFQEQQLATRLICFTSGELQWRCKNRTVCECGDIGDTVEWRFPYSPSQVYADDEMAAELSDFWHNAVLQIEDAFGLSMSGKKMPFRADVDIDVVTGWSHQPATEAFGIRAGSQNYLSEEIRTATISLTRLKSGCPPCNAWAVHLINLNEEGRQPRRYFLVVGRSLRKPGAFEHLGLLIQTVEHGSDRFFNKFGEREVMTIV